MKARPLAGLGFLGLALPNLEGLIDYFKGFSHGTG
jgi:hypothetical protein